MTDCVPKLLAKKDEETTKDLEVEIKSLNGALHLLHMNIGLTRDVQFAVHEEIPMEGAQRE
jgi:hypothetical protein